MRPRPCSTGRPVVVVPPGKLHTIPWGLLPALRDCVITVAPSAAAWLRAQRTRPPSRRHVTLTRRPGLATEGAEVPAVARLYDDVTMLAGADATTDKLHSTGLGWPTLPPTAPSAPTARCSPPCACMTGR